MNREQLKDLVMQHFNLVPAPEVKEEPKTEETVEETVEVVEEKFGSLEDINSAFTLVFPGEEPKVGDKVKVVTSEGQEVDAPNGYHETKSGLVIKTEGSVITEIEKKEEMGADPSISVVEGTKPDNDTTKINADQKPVDAMEKVNMAMDEMGTKVAELEGKVKEMMAKMEEMKSKFSAIAVEPASERTLPTTKFEKTNDDFNTSNNADLMKLQLERMKSKKK